MDVYMSSLRPQPLVLRTEDPDRNSEKEDQGVDIFTSIIIDGMKECTTDTSVFTLFVQRFILCDKFTFCQNLRS